MSMCLDLHASSVFKHENIHSNWRKGKRWILKAFNMENHIHQSTGTANCKNSKDRTFRCDTIIWSKKHVHAQNASQKVITQVPVLPWLNSCFQDGHKVRDAILIGSVVSDLYLFVTAKMAAVLLSQTMAAASSLLFCSCICLSEAGGSFVAAKLVLSSHLICNNNKSKVVTAHLLSSATDVHFTFCRCNFRFAAATANDWEHAEEGWGQYTRVCFCWWLRMFQNIFIVMDMSLTIMLNVCWQPNLKLLIKALTTDCISCLCQVNISGIEVCVCFAGAVW